MSNEPTNELTALARHTIALHGQLAALSVFTDAILATMGKSLPPLMDPMARNLRALADATEPDLEPAQLDAFRALIEKKLEAIALLSEG